MAKVFTRNGIEVLMLATFIVMGVVGECLFHFFMPQYYFHFYRIIVVLFMLQSIVMHACIKRWEVRLLDGRISRAKAFNNFMTAKIIKLFVYIVIILCYVKLGGEQKTAFLITFMIFYLVSLALETTAQYSFEMRAKARVEEDAKKVEEDKKE